MDGARGARPRAAVIHEAWQRLDGVAALSGAHGGPLSRTVKLILDPLVIRPVQHPLCAPTVLTPDGAVLLTSLILASGDVLRDTARWFDALKKERRRLRITDGHPQDRYFQRCFELATEGAVPGPATAERVLRALHGATEGRTTRALKDHLADPATAARLRARLDTAWAARETAAATDPPPGLDRLLTAVLDGAAGTPHPLAELARLRAGTATGLTLADPERVPPARRLGLTAHPVPGKPRLTDGAVSFGPPLDRTVHERVFTTLRSSSDRSVLPPLPRLVTEEIDRCCAPWGLTDETLRVAAALGEHLALGLRPLTAGPDGADGAAGGPAPTAAQRAVDARWRREAYVLRARRMLLRPDAGGAPPDDPLRRIADELRRPWQGYLRRLWARLHGRDVRRAPVTAPDELWDLLDGVARSVILDHRARVRQALTVRTAVEA
ncbi:hypothetical protein ACFV5N_03215 [Streptomyces sp. NPDC059853]|uniref:hypothetical protein n=1 Tax=Streptomyces sp. NPDC059853 TaxID=3346973 RepID=UPI0036513592